MANTKKKSYMDSDDLIAAVKRKIMAPINQATFTDDDILAFADEEMSLGLVPSILQLHEDYLMYTEKIPLEANVTKYDIPYRAIGNKLREVQFTDSSQTIYPSTRIGVGDLNYFNTQTVQQSYAFYVENNQICLVPLNFSPAADTYIILTYYMRPNVLVPVANVATVNSIDRVTGIVQLSNMPTLFASGQLYDLIKVQSPNKTLDYDILPISVNTTSQTMTFNLADIPDALAPGDNIALAEECAIPQVPSDLHIVLAHRTSARLLEAMGDTEGLQNSNAKLAEYEAKTMTLIDNRVEDAPKKAVQRNGTLRSGMGWNRRGRF